MNHLILPRAFAPHPCHDDGKPSRPRRTGVARRWLAALLMAASALARVGHAEAGTDSECPDNTVCSPYFVVLGADPALDSLPLKATDVQVDIAGVIAEVTVTQTYRNEGQRTLEARYVFPGSTQSAVHALQMRLGDRVVHAQIREKQQAQAEYQQAKAEGKTAALMEQHRPNVFQMNLANILPGDTIEVELTYTELLVPTEGRYQFMFPTVVGPRYHSADASHPGDQPFAQAILPPMSASGTPTSTSTSTSTSTDDFSLHLQLHAPMPIQHIASASHAIRTTFNTQHTIAQIALQDDGRAANTRDFLLDYQLAGAQIASGLLLHEGQDENFFIAMIEPPKAVADTHITPRDYIFVVDISGSMHGFPLDTAKTMLRDLISSLRPSDTFNVMLFSGSNQVLHKESVPASAQNIRQAIATIDSAQGGGSTELIPALRRAIELPKAENVSRSIVVVTDGYVSVEREAYVLVRNNLHRANVFAFGIGSAVNRHLIDSLARAGMGEPFVITDATQARSEAARFRRMIERPVLTGIQARFEGVDVYDLVPPQVPDVLSERPVVLMGKWRAPAAGQPAGRLVLSGHTANLRYTQEMAFAPSATESGTGANHALRLLWARQQIASLTDEQTLLGSRHLRDAITALGLQYALLTDYTSFLAVDQRVRRADGDDATLVDQPTPLPDGVSPLAVASHHVPSTPEPATWGALLLIASLLAVLTRHRQRQSRQRYTR